MPRHRTDECTKITSNDPKLDGVVVNIYTSVVGRFKDYGHCIWMQCKDFTVWYRDGVDGKEPQLAVAEFDPKSIKVIDQIDWETKEPKEPHYGAEDQQRFESKIVGRYVLDVRRYPEPIKFEMEEQDAENVQGILHMHGKMALLRCTRRETATHIIADCPVVQTRFGITPYGIGQKWFAVNPEVNVEISVPKTVVKSLQAAQGPPAAQKGAESKKKGWF